jgi:hypothetical protein
MKNEKDKKRSVQEKILLNDKYFSIFLRKLYNKNNYPKPDHKTDDNIDTTNQR